MDPEQVHELYKDAVRDSVEYLQKTDPSQVDNWPLYKAFISREYFENKYPTLRDRLNVIERLNLEKEEVDEVVDEIKNELENGEAFSYLAMEDLRYNFPEPDEIDDEFSY